MGSAAIIGERNGYGTNGKDTHDNAIRALRGGLHTNCRMVGRPHRHGQHTLACRLCLVHRNGIGVALGNDESVWRNGKNRKFKRQQITYTTK